MTDRLLLCTDLDRTVLPNGRQPESPEARPRLRALAARDELALAYVSGRHRAILAEAMREYELPVPDYAVADVGTTIYALRGGDWLQVEDWHRDIGRDWDGAEARDLAALLEGMTALRPQEPEKQGRYKLSYYAPAEVAVAPLLEEAGGRLAEAGLRAALIWSIDEERDVGLLDVLPERATKLHAIEFLMAQLGHGTDTTVFGGDSGNDLPVLVSHVPAVLVANAREDVREQARREAAEAGNGDRLYCAAGVWRGMNGNYSAGLLEGLAHYHPQTAGWYD